MKSVIERLRKVFRLSPDERLILARAWGLFLLMDLALRILPLSRVVAISQKGPPKRRAPAGTSSVSRLARLVELAGRYAPVKATCLKIALVGSWILARKGIPTSLKIGVARQGGRLRAHAWLEREGEIVLGLPGCDGHEPLLPAR